MMKLKQISEASLPVMNHKVRQLSFNETSRYLAEQV